MPEKRENPLNPLKGLLELIVELLENSSSPHNKAEKAKKFKKAKKDVQCLRNEENGDVYSLPPNGKLPYHQGRKIEWSPKLAAGANMHSSINFIGTPMENTKSNNPHIFPLAAGYYPIPASNDDNDSIIDGKSSFIKMSPIEGLPFGHPSKDMLVAYEFHEKIIKKKACVRLHFQLQADAPGLKGQKFGEKFDIPRFISGGSIVTDKLRPEHINSDGSLRPDPSSTATVTTNFVGDKQVLSIELNVCPKPGDKVLFLVKSSEPGAVGAGSYSVDKCEGGSVDPQLITTASLLRQYGIDEQ